MSTYDRIHLGLTRRHFFSRTKYGIASAALSSLLNIPSTKAEPADTDFSQIRHFAPKAKRAIYLFAAGAPSQLDLLDYKPKMKSYFDQELPESVRRGQRLTTMTSGQARFPIAPSIYKFKQYGPSGAWISELLPYTAKMANDIAIVKTVWTEAINHDPAITYITTGDQLPGKASLGAWLNYGLGTANDNLPAFVVMTPKWSAKRDAQALYARLWGNGFLPSKFQGVALRSQGDPVLYLSNPSGVSQKTRRRMLDTLNKINQQQFETTRDSEIQTRISQYEMAYRMQVSVPELTSLSDEPESTFKLYGPDSRQPGTFASSCLLARRMAERGVRFVQVFHRGWDHHGQLTRDLPLQCRDIDQPAYALVQDLKQRGLLDDTLVIWGGEFGRTTYCQGKLTEESYGRDHHPRNFCIWMAGGGIQGGLVHGQTDDFSYNITDNPVHVRDLNATILHCLGMNHSNLTFPFQGLDQRLTGIDAKAQIIHELLS